jgi:hypothetical protein
MQMARNRPLEPAEAPDTARVYERARPEAEGGMGRLDNEKGTPTRGRDRMLDAISNKHKPRQLNADDEVNLAGGPVIDPVGGRRKTRRDIADEKRAIHRRKLKNRRRKAGE